MTATTIDRFSEAPRPQSGASKTILTVLAFSLLYCDIRCNSLSFPLSLGLLTSAQSIQLAKNALPTTLASLQHALEISHLLLCSLASLPRLILTSSVEMIQTSAHDLPRFLTYRSLFLDSLLSRRIAPQLSCAHHHARPISDTLVPIPNDILSRILYGWFALAPSFQYSNSALHANSAPTTGRSILCLFSKKIMETF